MALASNQRLIRYDKSENSAEPVGLRNRLLGVQRKHILPPNQHAGLLKPSEPVASPTEILLKSCYSLL